MNAHLSPDLIDRTISAFGKFFAVFNTEHLFFILISALPAMIWLYIFLKYQKENKFLATITFLGGMLAMIPIFILKHEIARIEGWIEIISWSPALALILSALWIGLYKETAKHWIVKSVDQKLFRNIDDAIQLSIIAALGFAFIENIIYFHSIWGNESIGNFWLYYSFRSLGLMFLHIFASGIFGYYYGIAHFAKPVLKSKLAKGKKFVLTKWFHKILHLKSETVFYEEKILEGLILAAGLHGIFDFMMGMSQNYFDLEAGFPIKFWPLMAVPFLVGGYLLLTSLLKKKENHKIYCEVYKLEEYDLLDKRSAIKKIIKPIKQ